MTHIAPSQKLVISDEVLGQEIDGESVLLDLRSEKYFGLNPVGTRVWQLLNERKSMGNMLDILHSEYAVNRKQLEKDVGDLLERMLQAGLVTLSTPDAE